MLKITARQIVVGVGAGLLAGMLMVALESDFHGEICEYNQAANHEDCTVYSLLPFLLIQVGKPLNDFGVAITALATIIIAAFTGKLWFSTNQQARLTRESIELARKEFIATHRPRVIVRFIQGPLDDAKSSQFIWVTIANIGVNPATVEFWGCDLARRDSMTLQWAIPGLDASLKPIPPIRLISGQRHTFTITARNPGTFDETFPYACGTQQLCAVGGIRYTDGSGIARETGFFRIYDNVSKNFVASKNNGEEYQD